MTLTVAPDLTVKLYNTYKTLNSDIADPQTTNIWFPLPPGVTSLPSTPTYDVNSELIAYNSTEAPSWFDPENVDLEQFFNDLLPSEVNPQYLVELDAPTVLPAQQEITLVDCSIKCIHSVYTASYALVPQITNISLPIKVSGKSVKVLTATKATYTYTGQSAELDRIIDPAANVGSFVCAGQAANLRASVTTLSADDGNLTLTDAKTVCVIRAEGTYLDLLEETDAYVSNTSNVQISFASSKFGTTSLRNNGYNDVLYLLRRGGKSTIKEVDDVTISAWFSCTQFPGGGSAYPVIGLTSTTGIFLYATESNYYFGYGYIRTDGVGTYVINDPIYFTPVTSVESVPVTSSDYYHLVVEVYNGQLYLYVNGQASSPVVSPGLLFTQTQGISIFNLTDGLVSGVPVSKTESSSRGYVDDIIIDKAPRYIGIAFPVPTAQTSQYTSVKFNLSKKLKTELGTFTCAGSDINFNLLTKRLTSSVGSITLNGQTVNYKRSVRKLLANVRNFTLTGHASIESPTFVSFSTFSYGAISPSVFTLPAGYAIGDIAIFVAETSGDAPQYPAINGWTLLNNQPTTNDPSASGSSLYVWWRRIQSTNEPPIALSVVDHIAAGIFLIRGAKSTGDPFAAYITSSTTTISATVTSSPLSVPNPSTLICTIAARPFDSSSTTFYSGVTNSSLTEVTERFEAATASNNGGGLALFTGKRLKSGTVTATTATKQSSTSDVVVVLAIRNDAGIVTPIPLRTLPADPGSYNLVGNSATLHTVFVANTGTFSVIGAAASFNTDKVLEGQVGSIVFNGQNVYLSTSRVLDAEASVLAVSGQNVNLKAAIIIEGATGSYTLAGQNSLTIYSRQLVGSGATFSLNGQSSTLTYTPVIGSLEDQFELTALLEDDLLSLDF